MKQETRYLTRSAAYSVIQNFRWFDYSNSLGRSIRVKVAKMAEDRYKVTASKESWSFVHLSKEDYA